MRPAASSPVSWRRRSPCWVYDLLHAAKTRASLDPERRRPFYVFLDEDYRVIMHWIERPKLANDQMREALSPVFGPSGTRQLTEKLGREPTDRPHPVTN